MTTISITSVETFEQHNPEHDKAMQQHAASPDLAAWHEQSAFRAGALRRIEAGEKDVEVPQPTPMPPVPDVPQTRPALRISFTADGRTLLAYAPTGATEEEIKAAIRQAIAEAPSPAVSAGTTLTV